MGIHPLRTLSLCTGGGGLDYGLALAEPTARVICRVEIEAFAIEVLASQMEAGAVDDAPVWTDLRTFDGTAWRGAVDCVVAGFPCQDISSAGKRAGIRGKRSGLWFDVARIIRDVQPGIVFLENVDALIVRGVDVVLGDLAAMGFAAAWGVFSAAEVGAPHLRERWFCLAVPESRGRRIVRQSSGSRGQPDGSRQAVDDTHDRRYWPNDAIRSGRDRPERTGADDVADAGEWRRTRRGLICGRQPDTERRSEPLGSPIGSGLEGFDTDRSRMAGGLAGTRPTGTFLADADGKRFAGQRLSKEWRDADGRERPSARMATFPPDRADMRAWAEVQAGFEPAVCRLAPGLDVGIRTDWLRLFGNGVVPQQAAHAYRTLRSRLMQENLWP